MERAHNDATLQQAGTIYQYLIALQDCFELENDDVLQIEVNGDVSIINHSGGKFQKEVKHHFSNKKLGERDEDFWKTLSNWYVEYDRVKTFTQFILSTTADITEDSVFSGWNTATKEKKLSIIKEIGKEQKQKEVIFREFYQKIFNDEYNEGILLKILNKFSIYHAQNKLPGISKNFEKYIIFIPEGNRDNFIGAMLGEILIKVKDPPHKWEVSKKCFEEIVQSLTPAYCRPGETPLPTEYARVEVPTEKLDLFQDKAFVRAIKDIRFEENISAAISDYWKADMTVARYFRDDQYYLRSLDLYERDLEDKMIIEKKKKELDAEGEPPDKVLKFSKKLYLDVIGWDARDFGSIIRNQGYFQRGVIHSIVDELDFTWKIGEKK